MATEISVGFSAAVIIVVRWIEEHHIRFVVQADFDHVIRPNTKLLVEEIHRQLPFRQ